MTDKEGTEKTKKAAAAPKKTPASPEKLAVGEWAAKLGYLEAARNPGLRGRVLYKAPHAAAAALHGWARYEHMQGKQFQCSRETYEAAVGAAMSDCKPCDAALAKD